MIVIDGNGMVFGRLASQAAKKALGGEEVHIINCERIIISGNPDEIVARYRQKRRLQNKANPEHSPKWPKVPHMFVKRLVRGMLPRKTARGMEAYRRMFLYAGNPKNLKPSLVLENAKSGEGTSRCITIIDLCRQIGYSG